MKLRHWIYLLLNAVVFLIGILLTKNANAITSSVGTSVVATGICGWLLFLWVMVTDASLGKYREYKKMGILSLFSERSVAIKPEYDSRIEKAKKRIDIIGFGLKSFREDYSQRFEALAANVDEIRILLIDPEFPERRMSFADQRDREERENPGKIKEDVRIFIESTNILRTRYSNFRVRLYRSLPSINYFRIDNEAFWGPYLVGMPSRKMPTAIISKSSPLFDVLEEHFENIWSSDELSREI